MAKLHVLRSSEGAALLKKTTKPDREIAVECRVSKSLVGAWKRGERSPILEFRLLLQTLYGIPPGAWDRPHDPESSDVVEDEAAATIPIPPPPPSSRPPPPSSPPPTVPVATTTTEFQAAAMARASHLLRVVDAGLADLGTCKDAGVRARQVKDLATAMRILLVATGQSLTEAQIAQHPAVRRLLEEVVAACKPWPPAQKAIVERLRHVYG